MLKELAKLRVWLESNWKEITRREKLELKRSLEYKITLGLGPKKEKAAREVLCLLKRV